MYMETTETASFPDARNIQIVGRTRVRQLGVPSGNPMAEPLGLLIAEGARQAGALFAESHLW